MAVVNREVLDRIIEDESAGAGNFVHRLDAALPPGEQAPLVFVDSPVTDIEGRSTKALTVGQIVGLADHLAGAYARLGIGAKEPVALYLDDTIDYFINFVALTSIGAFPVFINGGLDPSIAVPFLMSARPRLVVATPERRDLLEPGLAEYAADIRPALTTMPEVRAKGGGERPAFFVHHADDPILLAHTSGTTGIPKAVIFTHESMFHGVRQQISTQRGERILSMMPHSHGASLSLLMLSITRGAKLTIQTDKAPDAVLTAIETDRPDVVAAFPKTFVDLCRLDLTAYDLDSVQYWIATGDANHEPHVRKLIAQGHHVDREGNRHPGSRFVDNLGSSEFAFAMFRNIHGPGTETYDRCIGKPFSWVRAAVLADDGSEMPPNTVGKLGVISKSVTKGYWNNSNLTEQNRLRGYWLTGDLVYRDDNGIFFHVDRTSDYIETHTGILYSCQAEELFLKHIPEIFEASVYGRVQDDGTFRPSATVELAEGSEDADLEDIRDRMNALLRDRGLPEIAGVKPQSGQEYVGVTGKKLKRRLRAEAF